MRILTNSKNVAHEVKVVKSGKTEGLVTDGNAEKFETLNSPRASRWMEQELGIFEKMRAS